MNVNSNGQALNAKSIFTQGTTWPLIPIYTQLNCLGKANCKTVTNVHVQQRLFNKLFVDNFRQCAGALIIISFINEFWFWT